MDKKIIEQAVKKAVLIRNNAYAPYSGFKVGAVVITKDGDFFEGVNVENSSYGATICAERNAIFSAVTNGKRDIEAVVIASELRGKAVFPCGICRQVLADFNPEMKVILVNAVTSKIEKELSLSEIFSNHFVLKS